MIRKKCLVLSVFLLIVFGCNENDVEVDKPQENHLKYFGFALTDYELDRLDEIDDFVNLVDLSLENFESIHDKLEFMTVGNN